MPIWILLGSNFHGWAWLGKLALKFKLMKRNQVTRSQWPWQITIIYKKHWSSAWSLTTPGWSKRIFGHNPKAWWKQKHPSAFLTKLLCPHDTLFQSWDIIWTTDWLILKLLCGHLEWGNWDLIFKKRNRHWQLLRIPVGERQNGIFKLSLL